MPGKTLSLRATAQVFYKYNNEDGEEVAVSPQYDFDRLTCNSKSMSASWAETIELVCETTKMERRMMTMTRRTRTAATAADLVIS